MVHKTFISYKHSESEAPRDSVIDAMGEVSHRNGVVAVIKKINNNYD